MGIKINRNETFELNHNTALPNKENKIMEIRRGQKEVWTAKKGLINTIQ